MPQAGARTATPPHVHLARADRLLSQSQTRRSNTATGSGRALEVWGVDVHQRGTSGASGASTTVEFGRILKLHELQGPTGSLQAPMASMSSRTSQRLHEFLLLSGGPSSRASQGLPWAPEVHRAPTSSSQGLQELQDLTLHELQCFWASASSSQDTQ